MIHGVCGRGLDKAHYLHSFQNLAKDGMFTIQPGGLDASDEKLGTIGVWSWREKRTKFLIFSRNMVTVIKDKYWYFFLYCLSTVKQIYNKVPGMDDFASL